MPGWMWVFIIAGAIVLAVIVLVIFATLLPWLLERAVRAKYWREGKRRNEKARQYRIAQPTWENIPMPQGKEGHLVITPEMWLDAAPYVRQRLEKVLFDRARDLGVALEYSHDVETQEIHVRWGKNQKKIKKH